MGLTFLCLFIYSLPRRIVIFRWKRCLVFKGSILQVSALVWKGIFMAKMLVAGVKRTYGGRETRGIGIVKFHLNCVLRWDCKENEIGDFV